MKLATRAKLSTAAFLTLIVISCLVVPLNGIKHDFLGYHLIWQRPETGVIDDRTLQIEWVLSLAASVALFFSLEELAKAAAFLRKKQLILVCTALATGAVICWLLMSNTQTFVENTDKNTAVAEAKAQKQ